MEVTSRRKAAFLRRDFALISVNVDNNSINVCNNSINVYSNEQSKVKKSKVKKIKEINKDDEEEAEKWRKWNENEVRKDMRISKLEDLSSANRDNQVIEL